MWRAFFLAVGVTCCILGAECLVVHEAQFSRSANATQSPYYEFPQPPRQKSFQPPDWAPWSLLTAGAVILIYSVTLNKTEG